jgi:hypothetical protein
MPSSSSSPRRPQSAAEDAAALLRRIGFAILVLAVPVAAMVSRRATVVLAPIGVVLIVIASFIDGEASGMWGGARRILSRPETISIVIFLGWAFLSLLWTPFASFASDKLFNILATIAMIMAAVVALPEKMRASNLYLMAIGTALATLFAGLMTLTGLFDVTASDTNDHSIQRGLIVLAIFIWPSIGWLASRGRKMEALLLGGLAFISALAGSSPILTLALLAGALTFGFVLFHSRFGGRALAWGIGGLIVFAPLIPFVLELSFKLGVRPSVPLQLAVTIWSDIITSDPVRLITGHGAEAALRSRLNGLLPAQAPNSLLFEIWYDYGIVGAFALASACVLILQRLAEQKKGFDHALVDSTLNEPTSQTQSVPHPMLPAKFACFVTAGLFAALGMGEWGLGTTQVWWLTSLGIIVIAFVAADRGQFRHRLPKAWIGFERRKN